MATFKVQIEDLTGSVSDDAALTDWLTAGSKELINIFPPKLKQKCVTATGVGTDFKVDLDGLGEVLYVTRENADSGFLVPCREIPSMYGGLAFESSGHMMYEPSVTDPVYWIDGDNSGAATLYVKPTPTANQPAILHHIAYPTVAYGDSTIANFPDEAEYLVVLYASIKGLQRLMNNLGGISDLSISSSAPTIPGDPNIGAGSVSPITIDALPSAPNYTAPTITTDGGTIELTTLVSLDAENTIDDFDGNAIEFDQWFSTVTHLIEDEEDVELASASLQKIQTYIQAYSSAMQNQLNIFNEGNAVYQAAVQRNLEQARINMQDAQKEADLTLQAAIQDYSLELQKYQQELALYQQNVNKEVTQYTTNLQQYGVEYQWYQGQQAKLQQDYDKGVQMLISGGAPQQRAQQ